MRKLFLFFIAITMPLMLTSQDEKENYLMWETIMLTPDNKALEAFGDAMTHHNKTYHNSGPYTASVYSIVTGPNTGKMIWMMGPCTFTDLDSRPGGDDHDLDWSTKVLPHVKKVEQGEYWKMDMELSNLSPDSGQFSIYRVRFHEVRPGQGHRIKGLLEKISATVKSMDGDNPWGIYYNEFQQGYTIGRHIATVSYFNSWSELDDKSNFKQAYEALHGDDSWTGFINDIESVFSNSWDELWTTIPEMGGETVPENK